MGTTIANYRFIAWTLLFLATSISSKAQSPAIKKISLNEMQQLFVKNNYQLIASRFQVDQAKADIITAKLFDNPELSYENILYNPETKKFLETSLASGQYQGALSQMIRLAGKRNKNIQLAVTGSKMAEYQYFDLMRTLRFDLNSSFYKAYFLQQSARVYEQQVSSLTLLVNTSEKQLQAGNIASKDLIRIKSLLYGIKAEYTAVQNNLEDLQTTLKLLTNIPASIELELAIPTEEPSNGEIKQKTISNLLDSARLNRADLRWSEADLQYAKDNLKVQKANAIPDLEISLTYDLQGSYIQKYTGLGLKLPIPLFNRNQGEVKKAKIAIEAGSNALMRQESILENEVYNTFNSAVRAEELYDGVDKNFHNDFEKMTVEVIKNFRSRNISLIEFLDFYDSFKTNTLQMNDILFDRMNTREELNFVTGSNIFK